MLKPGIITNYTAYTQTVRFDFVRRLIIRLKVQRAIHLVVAVRVGSMHAHRTFKKPFNVRIAIRSSWIIGRNSRANANWFLFIYFFFYGTANCYRFDWRYACVPPHGSRAKNNSTFRERTCIAWVGAWEKKNAHVPGERAHAAILTRAVPRVRRWTIRYHCVDENISKVAGARAGTPMNTVRA